MGLKQFQRGMQYRFKYIRLRLRLQVRHMAMHRKARKAITLGPACDTAALTHGVVDRIDARAAAPVPSSAPLPTLRRRVDQKAAQ